MADQLREKIELQIGVPVTVAFQFASGKLCSKRWPGAEDTYSRGTNDGRVLFVGADEEMRLRKVVRAGEAVILCREKTRSGAKYLTIKSAPPQLKAPLGVVNGGIPVAKYASEPPTPAFPECVPAATRVNDAPAKPEAPNLITRCMRAAIEAAADATARGNELNFPVSFSGSDIQDLASTLYIQASKSLSGPDGREYARKPNGRASGYTNGTAAGAQR